MPRRKRTVILTVLALAWVVSCVSLYLLSSKSFELDLTAEGHFMHAAVNNTTQPWISLGAYLGLKYFYVKNGSKKSYNREKTITLASMCDINLIKQARHIALTYEYGPISFAIYIDDDADILSIDVDTEQNILNLIQSNFNDISNIYDIYIALLFVNKSNKYYQSKQFDANSSMLWKLPYNALRNMAEIQVRTAWLFMVDIDFYYYSRTFTDLDTHFFDAISRMNTTEKTVFIVPAFGESKSKYAKNKKINFSWITKSKLLYLKRNKYVIPFDIKKHVRSQNCTDYDKWYRVNASYLVNDCVTLRYEPWYIMKTSVSRKIEWNNEYVGRGFNKISRMMRLRHHCFDLMVMHNMFMIHPKLKHTQKSPDVRGWMRLNGQLFRRDIYNYKWDYYMHVTPTCLPPLIRERQYIYFIITAIASFCVLLFCAMLHFRNGFYQCSS